MDALKTCLFDANGSSEPPFRPPFEKLSNVEVLGEVSTWEELRSWVRHAPVDLVAVRLDDDDCEGLRIVERVAELAPRTGIIGISDKSDAGWIISAMRAGCNQFVSWPIEQDDLRNAVNRIQATQQVAAHSAKRVCVIGSSGGVGTTMVACNLAIELGHMTNRTVGLVDLNLEFGDISCSFDCEPNYSVADVCCEGADADRHMLTNAVHELPCNVAVLARPESVEKARDVTPEGVQNTLRVMTDMYPFVIVDLPRAFSFMSAAAVSQAQHVLIVTQLSVPCIRNATRIYEILKQMGADEDRIEIVLNRCKASFERLTPEEVEGHFNRPLFAMIPNDYRRIQTSVDLGHPVMADAPNSPARLAIREMARKLASEYGIGDDELASKAGILKKFWKRPAKVNI